MLKKLLDHLPGSASDDEDRDPQQARTLRALFIVLLVDVVGFGIVIPLLPFYAAQFGASPAVVGVLFASFAAAQFVGVPVLGYLSDRWGRRPVLILSLFGSLAAFVLLAVANSLALLFLSRVIDGATGGNITTVRAAVADVTDERHRARGFGVIGAAFGVGFVVGPILGGLLSSISYALAGWTAAALTVVAIVLVWRWLPETRPEGAEPRDPPWTEARRLLGQHDIRQWLGIDLVWWSAFGAFQTAFPLFLAARLGYGAVGTGLLLALVGLTSFIVQTRFIGPASERYGDRRTLVGGLLLAAAGLAALSAAPGVAFVVLALLPTATGIAFALPSLASIVSQTVPPQEQGRLQGISGATESAGRGIGPVWSNGLIGIAGEGVAYASVAAVLAALSFAVRHLAQPEAGANKQSDICPVDSAPAVDPRLSEGD